MGARVTRPKIARPIDAPAAPPRSLRRRIASVGARAVAVARAAPASPVGCAADPVLHVLTLAAAVRHGGHYRVRYPGPLSGVVVRIDLLIGEPEGHAGRVLIA